jgi:hypothetical protein
MSEQTADFGPPETAPADEFGAPEPVDAPAAQVAAPTSLTAYRAVRGPAPEVAASAIAAAKDRRVSPQFAADNLDSIRQADEQKSLQDTLARNPVTAEYMGQSAPHAALAKPDVGVFEALEQGLSDLGYAELSTLQMSIDSPSLEESLQAQEQATAEYEQKHSGIVADLVRQAPMLGAFFLADKLGMTLGGKPGGAAASGGLMFGLNRGAIYRQIMAQMPIPETDAQGVLDPVEYEKRARAYATVGAGASAAIATGLSSLTSLAVGGATKKILDLSNGLVVRAFTNEATRDIVARLVDAGGHTAWGALTMAVPAVVDDVTVQKATTGQIDYSRALEHGWDALKASLLTAGALASIPHVVPLVKDVGRISRAPMEAAHLDHLVDQAKASTMVTNSPAEAENLIGKMADQGTSKTVYIDHEAATDPAVVQKLVEALADEGRAVAEAQATQSDVAVPVEKYLVRLRELHDQIAGDVKLSPDGLTPDQASLLADQLHREILPPEGKKGVDATTPTEEIPRLPVAMAARYGGTPEAWEKALTPDAAKNIAAVIKPDEATKALPPAADHVLWAEKLSNDTPIGELHPGRYELAARRAEDKLAEIAKQAATKGNEATGQAFIGAGLRDIGKEQTPKAGQQNLRDAGKKSEKAQKLLNSVPMLERARDQARAEAKAHADLAEEMQKARDYIAKRDTERVHADLAKASPEYADLFNNILESIDENMPQAMKQVRPLAVDQLLLRMGRDAEPVAFDADKLRDILGDQKSWQRLTPPEARVVLDAVKNIRSAARRQNELTLAGRKQALRDAVTGLRTYLDERGTPDAGPPAPSRASEGFKDKAGKTASALTAELIQPMRILRDRLGDLGNAIADDYVRARGVKEELAGGVGDAVWKMYEMDLPKPLKKSRFDEVKGPGSPAFDDKKWTRQDLWEFASWWGSESGQDRILRGLRINEGQAHTFLGQLTSAEVDFLNSKWKLNDEQLWPLISDHTKAVAGVAPPKIEASPYVIRTADGDLRELRGGYEPALYRGDAESTAKAPENAESIADYWGTLQDGNPSTANYFLKERAQRASSRLPDLNWSRYAGHVNSVLHYLAYDDYVRNTGRVFRDPEFRELVQRRLGPQYMEELDKHLGVAARGQVEAAQDGAGKWSAIVGGGLRSRLATAAFANPRVVLGQVSHLAAAMPALGLGPRDMLFGLSQSMRPSAWGESFDGSKQLPYRWEGLSRKMREQLVSIGPADKPSSRKWVDAASWSAYHAMDGFLSKTIFEAASSKAERGGSTPEEALAAGDKAVELMMPPLNVAEQSSFARDRGVMGSLLLVRNFPNTLFNVGAKLEWDARNQVFAADPGWRKARVALGAYGAAAAGYLGTVWAAHILGRFIMGHGRQPDETTGEWVEREALSAPFYPIPIVGEVVAPLAEAAVTHKKLKAIARNGLFNAPAIAELERAIRDLGDVVDPGTKTEDRVFAGLRLAANALNLPSEPLRGVQYTYDVRTGRFRPRGPLDYVGGAIYGKRKNQAKNPATVAQDQFSR